ncbi:MAG: ribosome silencing factor [Spirochaetes bacterium RBG_16_67_19]|nr:MAG: ribosome silencing factor [Spirochaetes bacterium RBG_16_67_19]
MEDTARTDALAVARLLEEHRGEDVVVLDVGEAAGWTDYFVIATLASSVRRRGVLRAVGAYLEARDIPRLNPHRLQPEGEGWILLDCGRMVIHLMDPEARAFYELEKLWFRSQALYSSNSSRSSSSSSS